MIPWCPQRKAKDCCPRAEWKLLQGLKQLKGDNKKLFINIACRNLNLWLTRFGRWKAHTLGARCTLCALFSVKEKITSSSCLTGLCMRRLNVEKLSFRGFPFNCFFSFLIWCQSSSLSMIWSNPWSTTTSRWGSLVATITSADASSPRFVARIVNSGSTKAGTSQPMTMKSVGNFNEASSAVECWIWMRPPPLRFPE